MKKIIKHELCEVVIPANTTATKFNFPDLPNLKDTFTWGIQVYTITELPLSILSGNALPTVVQVLNNSFITLVDYSGFEFLKNAPALLFNTVAFDVSTSTNIRENNAKLFNGQKVNWNKSYISFTTSPGGGATLGYLVSINYSMKADQRA